MSLPTLPIGEDDPLFRSPLARIRMRTHRLQLFAFSFNSAQPAGNPNTNWDAIFVSAIEP